MPLVGHGVLVPDKRVILALEITIAPEYHGKQLKSAEAFAHPVKYTKFIGNDYIGVRVKQCANERVPAARIADELAIGLSVAKMPAVFDTAHAGEHEGYREPYTTDESASRSVTEHASPERGPLSVIRGSINRAERQNKGI